MYVVAAADGLPTIPGPVRRGSAPRRTGRVPVGLRHAIARFLDADDVHSALCGADLRGWHTFAEEQFNPGHPANCQRCAQLVAAAMSRWARHTAIDHEDSGATATVIELPGRVQRSHG